jgi:hypothetical protein
VTHARKFKTSTALFAAMQILQTSKEFALLRRAIAWTLGSGLGKSIERLLFDANERGKEASTKNKNNSEWVVLILK